MYCIAYIYIYIYKLILFYLIIFSGLNKIIKYKYNIKLRNVHTENKESFYKN